MKDFEAVFLGQSILKYRVPLCYLKTLNHIYETKVNELIPANNSLVGKIKKEYSLYYNSGQEKKMKNHNYLPFEITRWYTEHFKHYLDFNKIEDYSMKFLSAWVNEMEQYEYNPIHTHQGDIFTGLSSVLILKLPKDYGKEISASDFPQNGKLQMLGSTSGQFANIDYQPELKEGDFFIFPYDMRHGVYPFFGPETRRTIAANCDVAYNVIKSRGVI